MARDGIDIVLVGHTGHVEVEGTIGHAPERMHLVRDRSPTWPRSRCGIPTRLAAA